MDMSGAYIPLARSLFPNAEIIIDRFPHHPTPGRAFLKTRIAIMNQFDKKSLPYRALKITGDSSKRTAVSYLVSFHPKTFWSNLKST